MRVTNLSRRYVKPILIIMLLAMLAWTVTGCEDFIQSPSPSPPAEKPEKEVTPRAVSTADRAILTVYEHLLGQAESYQAKEYVADFYTACDNWSAKTEVFKDGSRIWSIAVDMTGAAVWTKRTYWRQANWFVLEDGKVIPSNRFRANALRIEADLQRLSVPPKP